MWDLGIARPHMREGMKLTTVEWRAYHEGYETALRMALKAMDLAVDRWRAARAMRRSMFDKDRGA